VLSFSTLNTIWCGAAEEGAAAAGGLNVGFLPMVVFAVTTQLRMRSSCSDPEDRVKAEVVVS